MAAVPHFNVQKPIVHLLKASLRAQAKLAMLQIRAVLCVDAFSVFPKDNCARTGTILGLLVSSSRRYLSPVPARP
jgi:hypothetical protein